MIHFRVHDQFMFLIGINKKLFPIKSRAQNVTQLILTTETEEPNRRNPSTTILTITAVPLPKNVFAFFRITFITILESRYFFFFCSWFCSFLQTFRMISFKKRLEYESVTSNSIVQTARESLKCSILRNSIFCQRSRRFRSLAECSNASFVRIFRPTKTFP